MKKKLKIALLILTIILALYLVLRIDAHFAHKKNVLNTQNPEDYSSSISHLRYPPEDVFLDTIPSNASVVSFSYYNYWRESEDYYLELKFGTKEELDACLEEIKAKYLNYLQRRNSSRITNPFIEKQNPHDNKFVDLFYTEFHVSTAERDFVGYETEILGGKFNRSVHFMTVSYSYEDLTVIHSFASGNFYNGKTGDYIPKYFVRFGVPTNEIYERYYDILQE
ncbi:MAG: hypothetical protein J6Q85_00285 [Clostridia bacterium]|nr:hypothetical protein [Clostridia bacterium]